MIIWNAITKPNQSFPPTFLGSFDSKEKAIERVTDYFGFGPVDDPKSNQPYWKDNSGIICVIHQVELNDTEHFWIR